jgi:hypothetical protein
MDTDDPNFIVPNMERAAPTLKILRIETVEPRLAKSSSDSEDPNRVVPKNEKEDPMRLMLRIDIEDPRIK